MNLIQLHDNSKRIAQWRGAGYGQNENWVLKSAIPYVGTHSLLFQAECNGETVKGTHIVNIMFTDVQFVPESKKTSSHKELEYKGEKYYYTRPTLKTQCKVRCSCADFYYTFAYYNFRNKALFGAMPKPYHKKTNKPPRNPEHLAGMCKHIFQLQSFLRVHDYIN